MKLRLKEEKKDVADDVTKKTKKKEEAKPRSSRD